MVEVLLWVLVVLLVLVGIAGVVFPALPGTPLVFIGLLLAAYIDDFTRVGWVTIAFLGILTLISFAVDLLATMAGAKRVGASGRAIWGSALGAVVGVFFGIPGLVLGPFIGAVAGEYSTRRNLAQAGRVGVGTWLGLLLGVALKIALIFTMLGIFATFYVF